MSSEANKHLWYPVSLKRCFQFVGTGFVPILLLPFVGATRRVAPTSGQPPSFAKATENRQGLSLSFHTKPLLTRITLTLVFCLLGMSLAYAANSPPSIGAITPSLGTSKPDEAVSFTTTYIDQDGWQNIQHTRLLINSYLNSANCFNGYYNQNSNKLLLRNDANTGWSVGYAPGSNNIIENKDKGTQYLIQQERH